MEYNHELAIGKTIESFEEMDRDSTQWWNEAIKITFTDGSYLIIGASEWLNTYDFHDRPSEG